MKYEDMPSGKIRVRIAFAAPTRIWQQELYVPRGSTAGQVLEYSSFADEFPEHTDHLPAMGIFGERCDAGRVMRENDRLELYRPLVFDPLESRRRRAGHKKSAKQPG